MGQSFTSHYGWFLLEGSMSWVHSQFSGPADHGVWLYDPLRRTDTWRCYGQSSMFKIQLARMVWTSMDSLCSSICLSFCNTAGHESFTAHQTSSFLWRVLHYTRHLVMNATGSFERSPVNSGMPLLHPYATWMTIPFSGFVPPGTTNAVDKQQAKEEFWGGSFFFWRVFCSRRDMILLKNMFVTIIWCKIAWELLPIF